MSTATFPAPAASEAYSGSSSGPWQLYFSRLTSVSPARWNLTTASGLGALIVIWGTVLRLTWASWGNLGVDSGRELYVAWQLSEGKTLYRDVWYTFEPGSPYFNSWLFRLFGVRLEVFYWAGSLAALLCAFFLLLIGMRFGSRLAGWVAGTVLLCSAFHPSLFCFPLPYSFGAVYGCLSFIVCVWLAVCAAQSGNRIWIFAASWAVAAALLLKLEFGISCTFMLTLLLAARASQRRSWKIFAKDLAVCLPAAVGCLLVIFWMISLKGFTFLTQENLQSWPTSYFMREYGKAWLAFTGFAFTRENLTSAALQVLVLLSFLQGLDLFAQWARSTRRLRLLRTALFLGSLAYLVAFVPPDEAIRWLFFPPDIPIILAAAALAGCVFYLAQPAPSRSPALPLFLCASAFVTFRILFRMLPWLYPIYFNGPALLGFFLLVGRALNPIRLTRRVRFRPEILLYAGCILATLQNFRRADTPSETVVPLITERGTVKVTPSRATQYRAALSFIREKTARGELVLSVPEDTSLYFLSGVGCPVHVYLFTPGLLAPGKMTEDLIAELDRKKIRYLIWSNRIFWEYGVPRFGVDFDKRLGDYLFAHYRRVGPLVPGYVKLGEWDAYVWERIPKEAPMPASKPR